MSADDRYVAITGSDTVLLDAAHGTVVEQRAETGSAVLCLKNKRVALELDVGSYLWLPGGTRTEQPRVTLGTANAKGDVVEYWPGYSEEMKPPVLRVVAGGGTGAERAVELDGKIFGYPGQVGFTLRTTGVQTLDSGELLVAFTFEPGGAPRYAPLQFFALDPYSVKATAWSPPLSTEGLPHATSATSDGSFVVYESASDGKVPPSLMVLERGAAKERLRIALEHQPRLRTLPLSSKGELVARAWAGFVNGIEPTRGFEVFDLRSGKRLWSQSTESDVAEVLFTTDDSLVVVTNDRKVTRRKGRDGTLLWELKIPPKPR